MAIEKVTLSDKFEQLEEFWTPYIVGELNGQHVKIAKFSGAFEWHSHEDADELFMINDGQIRIELRNDSDVCLTEGEFVVIPRGVEHRPVADEEAEVLLFEPAETVNTGDASSDRTVGDLERL